MSLERILTEAPVAITVVRGPTHVVELANARALEMWGCSEAHLVNRPLFEAVPELRGRGLEKLFDHARGNGDARLAGETALELAGQWFSFVIKMLRDGDESIDRLIVTAHEVTAEAVARKKAERAHAEMEAIVESFPEAIYVGDTLGITFANRAGLAVLGDNGVDDPRKSLAELFKIGGVRWSETGEPMRPEDSTLSRAASGETAQHELIYVDHLRGEDRAIRSSGAPIRLNGEIVGGVVTFIDVTEKRRAEYRLRSVIEASGAGLWEMNCVTGNVDADLRVRVLLGIPWGQSLRLEDILAEIHPEDQERVRNLITLALAGEDGGSYSADYRTMGHGELSVRSIESRGQAFFDETGRPLRFISTALDITDRRRAEAELKSARVTAEEANRIKDDFLATVSHELRTPLTSMLGWLQMIRTGMCPPEKREQALRTVERNARAQAQLIEDLLDVSRIISGKLSLDMEMTDIAGVVAAAVETVRPAADAKQLTLEMRANAPGVVLGDAHRLQQVVWNLLANAVKFTPAGGKIRVRIDVAPAAAMAEIEVSDNGTGIVREFLPHVFDRFRQAEEGMSRRAGGLGLGLSIVQYLVEAHRGTVTAASDGYGKGSTFTVRLPLADPAATAHRAAASQSAGSREKLTPPPGLAGMHVLIVDDEPDTREYLRTLLTRCLVRVTEASNVEEALHLLVEKRPDVVISDIAMPGEDGYVLIRKLRTLPASRGGNTPAIALTAYARTEDRTRAMLAGFTNHVAKPVEPEELFAVVTAVGARSPGRYH